VRLRLYVYLPSAPSVSCGNQVTCSFVKIQTEDGHSGKPVPKMLHDAPSVAITNTPMSAQVFGLFPQPAKGFVPNPDLLVLEGRDQTEEGVLIEARSKETPPVSGLLELQRLLSQYVSSTCLRDLAWQGTACLNSVPDVSLSLHATRRTLTAWGVYNPAAGAPPKGRRYFLQWSVCAARHFRGLSKQTCRYTGSEAIFCR